MRTSTYKSPGVIFRCTQIKMYSWDNAQVVLVGNKCDLEHDRAVIQDRGKRLADQMGNFLNIVSWMYAYFVVGFLFALYVYIYIFCVVCYVFKGFYR
jgi:GTPase SAR1 family protein